MKLPGWLDPVRDNAWPWLCAIWCGLLIGCLGGAILSFKPNFGAVVLVICAVQGVILLKKEPGGRIPYGFPLPLFALITLVSSFWLINAAAGRVQEKADRYDEIIADWRADMHREATDRIENYVLLERMKR